MEGQLPLLTGQTPSLPSLTAFPQQTPSVPEEVLRGVLG